MEEKQFKATHLITLPNGKITKAMEDEKEKGFYYYDFYSKGDSEPILTFISAKEIKSPEPIAPKPLFAPLSLMGFFVDKESIIRWWVWKPSKDIEGWQLSYLIAFLFTSGSPIPLKEKELDTLPFDWKPFFEIKPVPPGVANSKEYQLMIRNFR